MKTKAIEVTLKEQALELAKGDQKQKEFGEKVRSLALEMEEYRKASETPINADNVKEIESGGSDRRLQPTRPWPRERRKWKP